MKKLWFKRRRYGYGWTPCRWEGWLTVLIYIAGLLWFLYAIDLTNDTGGILLLIFFLIWTALLITISIIKGERPRWQWGDRSDNDDLI